MNLSRREQILILIVGVVANFAVFKFGYLHFQRKAAEGEVRLTEARRLLAVDQNQLLTVLQSRGPSSVTGGDVVQDYVDANGNFANFVRKVVADPDFHQQVEVVRLAAESIEKAEGLSRVRYQLQVRAPFLAIGALIEKLEASALMVEITSLDIGRDGSDLKLVIGKLDLFHYVTRE